MICEICSEFVVKKMETVRQKIGLPIKTIRPCSNSSASCRFCGFKHMFQRTRKSCCPWPGFDNRIASERGFMVRALTSLQTLARVPRKYGGTFPRTHLGFFFQTLRAEQVLMLVLERGFRTDSDVGFPSYAY